MADVPAPRTAHDEVRIYIDADGTVTFCDLWEALLPVAEAVGDVAPACPLPAQAPEDADNG